MRHVRFAETIVGRNRLSMALLSGSSSIVNAILFEDCGAPDLPTRACRCSDRLLSAFRRRSRLGGKSTIFSCGLLHRLFEATPPTLLAGDESVGFRRTAAPSRIVRERWRRQSRPRFFDGPRVKSVASPRMASSSNVVYAS